MFDPNHFAIVCGQETLETIQKKSANLRASGLSLCDAQVAEFRDGFRDAELLESIYGWTVRSGSGLDNWRIIAGRGRHWTFDQAVEAAKAWQAEEPSKRFVWHRKADQPAAQA